MLETESPRELRWTRLLLLCVPIAGLLAIWIYFRFFHWTRCVMTTDGAPPGQRWYDPQILKSNGYPRPVRAPK